MTWQPIETAPKDGTHVLLLIPDYDIEKNYATGVETRIPRRRVIEGWWDADCPPFWDEWDVIRLSSHGCGCCSASHDQPTHWMPLPEMPS